MKNCLSLSSWKFCNDHGGKIQEQILNVLVWTTVLRRVKGDTFPYGNDSFKESYDKMETFWLRLYNLYELTKSGKVTLRIIYTQSGTDSEHSMEYAGFRILNNETFRSDYKLFKVIQGTRFDKV